MTYTINGKQYTKFDIKLRCAKLMGVHVEVKGTINDMYLDKEQDEEYSPCINPSDTDAIIDKCWDELMDYTNDKGLKPISYEDIFWTRWESLMNRHKCTKLVAACICLIEVNE
jgi:hypothetical protein